MADGTHKGKYDGFREIIFLLQYLAGNSSKEHKLSQAELIAALYYHKYGDITAKVYTANIGEGIPERVRRFIENFTNENILGYELHNSEEEGEKFTCPPDKAKKFYVTCPLSESTVNILRDSIAVYPYAEQQTTVEIINDLNSLTNKFSRNTYNLVGIDALKFPGTYYRNLQEIYKALSTSKADEEGARLESDDEKKNYVNYEREQMTSKKVNKLHFEYCRYEYDKEKKKLVLAPRKNKIGRTDRTVNPLMLIWSNGYYYLVTYYQNDKGCHYINFRVDRMINVKCTDIPADSYDDKEYIRRGSFDPKLYKACNPVMYSSGERCSSLKVMCSCSILNNAVDTFGFDINILEYDESNDFMIFEANDVIAEGALMWALEYGNKCVILEPAALRAKMKERCDIMAAGYAVPDKLGDLVTRWRNGLR